jgi:hypothetical protein
MLPADLPRPGRPLVLAHERRPTARRRRVLFALICAVVLCELLIITAVGTLRAHGDGGRDAPATPSTARTAPVRDAVGP